jgi:hypothetical protein
MKTNASQSIGNNHKPYAIMIGAIILLVVYLSWTTAKHSRHRHNKIIEQKDSANPGNPVNGFDLEHEILNPLNKFIRPVDTDHLNSLLNSYQPEILYSGLGNIFQIGNKVYKMQITSKNGQQFRFVEIDSCKMATLLDVFELSQNPIIQTDSLFTEKIPTENQNLSVESVSIDRSFMETESQILIVYTTCNQLPMTILSLQFLRNTDKLADLVVIDDHSTDGTVEYLRKRGFAVITKPKATGLTDSWNIGYRLAVALGYKNVVFTNNDVLLTTGSVALMYQGLRDYGLVVPLTTEKGAGHHPAQVGISYDVTTLFETHYCLSDSL